jgi:hypothetical protein
MPLKISQAATPRIRAGDAGSKLAPRRVGGDMSSHDPQTPAGHDDRESTGREAPDAPHGETPAGVKEDSALRNAERLPRLGNEEEKPADDRFGE